MNHRRIVIGAPALALTALTFGGISEASAAVPEDTDPPAAVVPHDPPVVEYNYPEYNLDPIQAAEPEKIRVMVPVDDTTTEAIQTGASALGGAGLAFGTLWFYRRRHPLAG